MIKIITTSAQETIEFGQKIASQLKGGEVICLYGNLGAGKTTLIKGIARGLGVKRVVTSPTFILMNIYKPRAQSPELRALIHIDCYRINKAEDIVNIGAAEYFGDPKNVVVIEWAERIKEVLPKERMEIKIEMKGEKERVFKISNS